MKKSLFSLLILSTLSLSTQAIARYVPVDSKNITIQGRVVKDPLTCQVQPVGLIKLQNAEIDTLESTTPTTFSIDFTGCTNPEVDKKVMVTFKQQDNSYLTNNHKGSDATNARVVLLDHDNKPIQLDSANPSQRTFSSNYTSNPLGYGIMFSLKYEGPGGSDKVTEGVFSSTLSFDAYVTDDIQ
ncbi:TPA: type 1 fimbrial protein [Proteus mirabilis]|uniref:fimbrial protein n=1 Tax=Proteus mirabilis TaxID=584 RepID=UPI001A214F13|nr:fimbrial protein [Proteus mirabilis]EMA1122029.1 type 1 fimbrial protein [Proteus mirabilis]MBI6275980.1 type 1 fimbrial protein [Proteus mirabilis]MBI6503285.1 type 1 fimbrial protein [Proteus mirabilis]MBI6518236.1 type 1 fimbrial protein [Proteus mirabilis]MDM3690094.1 type 1 fimbrial protein [Proteus mirabilis]